MRITRKMLKDLPEWFGIPDATEAYITGSADKVYLAAYHQNEPCGMFAVQKHFPPCDRNSCPGHDEAASRQGIWQDAGGGGLRLVPV
ncbi:MAG: hypothetical protein WA110_06015 [Anaerolineaceae bacterium]